MNCIEAKKLGYRFKEGVPILDNLDIEVPEGAIYGFLGPNGAGKTTTLKLLLGLLKKQQGTIRIFGRLFEEGRKAILKDTGSLIESPSVYNHLSCRENLLLWRQTYQCSYSRVGEVLKLTGMTDAQDKKAGKLSLGMKQRLGIAVALLNQPRLLILDEPTNGLDPNGIIEMRQLLVRLNREQGITIVISSHLLPEIEKLVTHLGIINRGNMLFQGPLNDLHTRQQQVPGTWFITNDTIKAVGIIHQAGSQAKIVEKKILVEAVDIDSISMINALLVQNNIKVSGIEPASADLESLFINMTK